ncbi:MAG TPA: aldose 1-epimerase family protein [Segetibacter sp.]
MTSISNNVLSIQISSKGAELQSIYHLQNKLEYLWSGDADYWGKKSPVLFPIVGELKNGVYSYKGKEYKLARHGFAREMEFELTSRSEDSVTFSIKSNKETLAVYPFSFTFSVHYTLLENSLQVTYMVENTGDDKMYFSVGGHPAFKVPLVEGTTYEDYELLFSDKETTGRYPLSPKGLIEPEPVMLLNNEDVLPLKKELFSADAIVLKELKSNSVQLKSNKTKNGLHFNFEGFPYLGLWETKQGDFLCIEPWCGIADSVNATGQLEEKEGINLLQPSDVFLASFTVSFF